MYGTFTSILDLTSACQKINYLNFSETIINPSKRQFLDCSKRMSKIESIYFLKCMKIDWLRKLFRFYWEGDKLQKSINRMNYGLIAMPIKN